MPPRVDYVYRGTGYDIYAQHVGRAHRVRSGEAGKAAAAAEMARKRALYAEARLGGAEAGEAAAAAGVTLTTALANYEPRFAAENSPPPDVVPDPPCDRCEVCGYLLTAPGHRIACGETS
jgi:hypothetical protein